jgi:hypothetical protein
VVRTTTQEDEMRQITRASQVLALLSLVTGTPESRAQSPTEPTRAQKSVRGTFLATDKSQSTLTIKSDSGQSLAWQFDATVVAEAAKFKVGAPIIVIYRQISANEKRVTALAFPGTAAKPTYMNMTGESVVVRSAPAVADACTAVDPASVTEVTIPAAGRAEVLEACWCCGPVGGTCTPGNKSGPGQAFLAQCFE